MISIPATIAKLFNLPPQGDEPPEVVKPIPDPGADRADEQLRDIRERLNALETDNRQRMCN